MSDSVVVITGASGGLGRALVEAFNEAGWKVAAAARREAIVAAGESILPLTLDVTAPGAAERVVELTRQRWGRLDVWINNAGTTADEVLPRLSPEDWDRVMEVNLTGAFRCCRAALPVMIRQRSGHLLNIASLVGRRGASGQAAYAAAKAGLIGLTQSLAAEVGRRGVQVNAILPGVMATAMTNQLSPSALEELRSANVLGRLNDPREVARSIVAIAGFSQVSGQVFQLDSRLAPIF